MLLLLSKVRQKAPSAIRHTCCWKASGGGEHAPCCFCATRLPVAPPFFFADRRPRHAFLRAVSQSSSVSEGRKKAGFLRYIEAAGAVSTRARRRRLLMAGAVLEGRLRVGCEL